MTELSELITEWIDWAAAGELLGVSATRVRVLIKEHQLAAVVPVAGEGVKLPAELIMDGEIVKGVPGLLTMLHDGRYDDAEILRWLFTPDDTLPERPIDALREKPHPTHLSIAQALEVAGRVQPARTLFTHICHELPHSAGSDLPDNVGLAYDGLKIELTP